MSDMTDERVTDEIEALRAILLDDELTIRENDDGEPECIETLVFPSTGEDSQSQYVCVRLVVNLLRGYPDVSPTVSLKNPRGLHEDTVQLIQTEAEAKCQDFIGQPVMFELIELVREHLTRSNLPTGQCAVCLYGFREGDEFTKTECYHHFHSHCLAAHVAAAERYYREEKEKLPQWQQDSTKDFQAICPVCREPINCDVETLWSAPPPIDVEAASEFSVTADLRELQRRMSALFLRQQERGGIIDPEAEGVKMLLRTEDESSAGAEQQLNPPGPSLNAPSHPVNPVRHSHHQHHHHHHHHQQQHQQQQQHHPQQQQQPQHHHHHHHQHHHNQQQQPQEQQQIESKNASSQQQQQQQNENQNESRQSHNNHRGHNNHHFRRNRGRGGRGSNRRHLERTRQTESAPR